MKIVFAFLVVLLAQVTSITVDVYVTGSQCQGTPTSEKVNGDNFCYEKMQIKCVSGQVQFNECLSDDCSGSCVNVVNIGTGVCYSPPKLDILSFVVYCDPVLSRGWVITIVVLVLIVIAVAVTSGVVLWWYKRNEMTSYPRLI